jgi:hypothetical protein
LGGLGYEGRKSSGPGVENQATPILSGAFGEMQPFHLS